MNMRHEIKFYLTKYLKPKYNFHGVYLYPDPELESGTLWWDIENPNNLSYSIDCLRGYVWDIFDDYCKLTDSSNTLFRENHIKMARFTVPDNHYYLNREDVKELTNRMYSINKIDFKGFYADIQCDWFTIRPQEDFYIEIGMRFMKCIDKKTGHVYTQDELGHNGGVLNKVFEDDNFVNDYEYTLFNPMNSYIIGNPLLFDNSYMYITNSINPLDKNGKVFKIW